MTIKHTLKRISIKEIRKSKGGKVMRIREWVKDQKNKDALISILLSAGLALVAIIISCFLGTPWKGWDNIRIIICTLLASLVAVLLASICWDIIIKNRFAEQLFNLAGISESMKKSGIEEINMDFGNIAWATELNGARNIEAVFTYSTRWGSNNTKVFKELIQSGCQIDLFLPDPENKRVIESLDQRFCQTDSKEKIKAAIEYYLDLGFTVFLYDGCFQNSYYKTEKTAIMSVFNHKKSQGRVHEVVPYFKVNTKGELYKYISSEIDSIRKYSKQFIRGV